MSLCESLTEEVWKSVKLDVVESNDRVHAKETRRIKDDHMW